MTAVPRSDAIRAIEAQSADADWRPPPEGGVQWTWLVWLASLAAALLW